MNLENEELLEAGHIDNSAVARAMLKKTGIQSILDREDITEVFSLRVKMAGNM